jgi:hypothetical protein
VAEEWKSAFCVEFWGRDGACHADYVFGWKGDALQRILGTPLCQFATNCSVESRSSLQSVEDMNKCTQKVVVDKTIYGCKSDLCLFVAPREIESCFLWVFANLFFPDV